MESRRQALFERLFVVVVGLMILGYGILGVVRRELAVPNDSGGLTLIENEDSQLYGWALVVAGTAMAGFAVWKIWRLVRQDEDWWF